ncbi:m20 protein [Murid betaherpesvirus 1]|uniref:M20 protein n=1 Tax=Murid herpesvirus 1 TaxID=10366 RepID=H2A251_MUHV1|nr:m20 protein [Murid betaherpesvirus 1]
MARVWFLIAIGAISGVSASMPATNLTTRRSRRPPPLTALGGCDSSVLRNASAVNLAHVLSVGMLKGTKIATVAGREDDDSIFLALVLGVTEQFVSQTVSGRWTLDLIWEVDYNDTATGRSYSRMLLGPYRIPVMKTALPGTNYTTSWGEPCAGVEVGSGTGNTVVRVGLKVARPPKDVDYKKFQDLSCRLTVREHATGDKAVALGIFPMDILSNRISRVGLHHWTASFHPADVAGKNGKDPRFESSPGFRFLVGTMLGAGTMTVIATVGILFAVVFKIVTTLWESRYGSDSNRHFQRFENPVDAHMIFGARGLGRRDRPEGYRGLPGAVAGLVPAAMTVGVAVAALTVLPTTALAAHQHQHQHQHSGYSHETSKWWSGGMGHVPSEFDKPRYPPGGQGFKRCTSSTPDEPNASFYDAEEALTTYHDSGSETFLTFDCPDGDCVATCRFKTRGQVLDVIIGWASQSGYELQDLHREWNDQRCNIRRVCEIEHYINPHGQRDKRIMCGNSGTCVWNFGRWANDLAGMYRCAVYFTAMFSDLHNGNVSIGQVLVDYSNTKEKMLTAAHAEAVVHGCSESTMTPYTESIIDIPLVYYRIGIFNWTFDSPDRTGDNGEPLRILAGAVLFNRDMYDLIHGTEGADRAYVMSPTDTVWRDGGGNLTFRFVVRKAGVYRGLLTIDGVRRYSCVFTVVEDQCARLKADNEAKASGFPSAAAVSLGSLPTARGPALSSTTLEKDDVGTRGESSELYARAIAITLFTLAVIAVVAVGAVVCYWGLPGASGVVEDAYSEACDGDGDTVAELVLEEEQMAVEEQSPKDQQELRD